MFTIKSALSKLLNSGTAKEKKAFTLVETLVTLVIIGVVSAVIIPNVVNKCQDIVYANKWKKIYSVFSQATTRIIAEDGVDNLSMAGLTGSDRTMLKLYLPYIKYARVCNPDNGQFAYGKCWHNSGKWSAQNGETDNKSMYMWSSVPSLNRPGLITPDGTFVVFATYSNNCAANQNPNALCGQIVVDVNGFKAPNVIGRDIFGMRVRNTRVTPASKTDYGACDKKHSGWGCSEEKLLK